jgi:DEAD/DEAH box helicase domain-containing protein
MNLQDLHTSVLSALTTHHFTVTDTVVEPARTAVLMSVPSQIGPATRRAIANKYPNGIYRHQAVAMEAALDGKDVVLTTPTASGKSLVFRAVAQELLSRNPNAKVLALFPTQALAEDQENGWKKFGIQTAMIHGGVPQAQRADLLHRHQVILMTPDVAHAWLLGMDDAGNRKFLQNLALLVLDEAHQYDGVFGTNMAFFLRRLTALAGPFRLIAASATLDNATKFVEKLSGRAVFEVGASVDGTGSPGRMILRARHSERRKGRAALIRTLGTLNYESRPVHFLAFVDGRQSAERLANSIDILPYRAGYEREDRTAIQSALAQGNCRGVVTTSALEVGLDIGELDVVALLGAPFNAKALRQRVGRCGRVRPGVCIVLDDRDVVSNAPGAFEAWLNRPSEANALYLGNNILQYANALCAAQELRVRNISAEKAVQKPAFADLPDTFRALLSNELDPQAPVADDLYMFKQRASQNSPHHEFPLRTSGAQSSWKIDCHGQRLGTLTHAQMLREAYPGATYIHKGTAYRVKRIESHRHAVVVETAYAAAPTYPLWNVMAFPSFDKLFGMRRSPKGFLAEVMLQVTERVCGFQRGGRDGEKHTYSQQSPYCSKDILGFLSTTGTCWFFDELSGSPEEVGRRILEAFCAAHGVHSGDVQVSTFSSKMSPIGHEARGIVIYDTTPGSLRLTSQLFANFQNIVQQALQSAADEVESGELSVAPILADLTALSEKVSELQEQRIGFPETDMFQTTTNDWVEMVATGETALLLEPDGSAAEVVVADFRYTPQGIMYVFPRDTAGVSRCAACARVRPVGSHTRMVRWNPNTDDRVPM